MNILRINRVRSSKWRKTTGMQLRALIIWMIYGKPISMKREVVRRLSRTIRCHTTTYMKPAVSSERERQSSPGSKVKHLQPFFLFTTSKRKTFMTRNQISETPYHLVPPTRARIIPLPSPLRILRPRVGQLSNIASFCKRCLLLDRPSLIISSPVALSRRRG